MPDIFDAFLALFAEIEEVLSELDERLGSFFAFLLADGAVLDHLQAGLPQSGLDVVFSHVPGGLHELLDQLFIVGVADPVGLDEGLVDRRGDLQLGTQDVALGAQLGLELLETAQLLQPDLGVHVAHHRQDAEPHRRIRVALYLRVVADDLHQLHCDLDLPLLLLELQETRRAVRVLNHDRQLKGFMGFDNDR